MHRLADKSWPVELRSLKLSYLSDNPNRLAILLIDSDEAFGQVLKKVLGDGYILRQAISAGQAIESLDEEDADVILVNFDEQDDTSAKIPSKLFEGAVGRSVPMPVIAYCWDGRGQRAQEAFRAGAIDILEQPLDIQHLKFVVSRVLRRKELLLELEASQRRSSAGGFEGLLGSSKEIERVNEVTTKVAGVLTTVLITGETGTGKNLVAEAIHTLSPRAGKPFVAFSVCSFPDSLIEDELFGHERGAFTGAIQTRRGRFEEANGGSIFIDEIGDLALPLQTKLLRVLQERMVERLGSNVSRPIDVRVICATHRNLERMMDEGTFRRDLYFRISVVKVEIPALRDHREDIPLLAKHFLWNFAKAHNREVRAFTPAFLRALCQHSWPGNVRELQNVMERSVVLAGGTEYLGLADLPEELRGLATPESLPAHSFQEAVQNFKMELVRSALEMHSGNKSKAAQELGISRCYLHRLLGQVDEGNMHRLGADDEELSTELEPPAPKSEETGIPEQPKRSIGLNRIA